MKYGYGVKMNKIEIIMKKYTVQKSMTSNNWEVYTVEVTKKKNKKKLEFCGTISDCYAYVQLDREHYIMDY